MVAIFYPDWSYFQSLIYSPVFLVATAFQIWMLIDAVRQKEWGWVVFIQPRDIAGFRTFAAA